MPRPRITPPHFPANAPPPADPAERSVLAHQPELLQAFQAL
jgi:hypothetical protein